MREIVFNPLRMVKGKIMVTSYMQWRKVKTADYNEFKLIIKDYKLPLYERVHNHKGDLLFWSDFDPSKIPVFNYNILLDLEEIRQNHDAYGILWELEGLINYFSKYMDCSGIPLFSHYTERIIGHIWTYAFSLDVIHVWEIEHYWYMKRFK